MTGEAPKREGVSTKRHEKLKYMQKPLFPSHVHGPIWKWDSRFSAHACYFKLHLLNRLHTCRQRQLSVSCAGWYSWH